MCGYLKEEGELHLAQPGREPTLNANALWGGLRTIQSAISFNAERPGKEQQPNTECCGLESCAAWLLAHWIAAELLLIGSCIPNRAMAPEWLLEWLRA